ncbi:hypothetical protein CASFOL_017196 [Castilleja foliolosa]|uniref:Uncharacterized protein n=1 Tax=Castilleja foliolosa TaxID=1961234 RepID=A0ABD3DDN6_9LAMI
MEETILSAEKIKVTKSVNGPCNSCFQDFFQAVLKCLGFESQPRVHEANSDDETCKQGSSSSSSSPAADPPADPPAELAAARIRRRPSPPTIGGGRGAQTNANPST